MATKQKQRNPTKKEKAKRKAKFQQKLKTQTNLVKKHHKAMSMQQDIIRRATIVDAIYNSRPELAIEKDGVLVLNEDAVYLNETDNVLYWKKDNNPIVSGLEQLEHYDKFTKEFINGVLEFISANKSRQQSNLSTDVDLEDFDLVEETETNE